MNNSSTHQKNHCMVVHAYYPLAETRVQRQAEALLALGYNVDVICIGGKKRPKQEMVRGVTVHRIRMGRDFLLPGFAGRLAAYIVFLLLAMFKLMRKIPKNRVSCGLERPRIFWCDTGALT
ncbi:MAG: hypothetical protein AAF485_04390 [Chloroflexota bacterium]